MDRAYLMVLVAPETWRQIYKGKHNDCLTKAFELGSNESWMIVHPVREHFGSEKFTITKT